MISNLAVFLFIFLRDIGTRTPVRMHFFLLLFWFIIMRGNCRSEFPPPGEIDEGPFFIVEAVNNRANDACIASRRSRSSAGFVYVFLISIVARSRSSIGSVVCVVHLHGTYQAVKGTKRIARCMNQHHGHRQPGARFALAGRICCNFAAMERWRAPASCRHRRHGTQVPPNNILQDGGRPRRDTALLVRCRCSSLTKTD